MNKSEKSPLTIVFFFAIIIIVIVVWFTSCKNVKSKEMPSPQTAVTATGVSISGIESEDNDAEIDGNIDSDLNGNVDTSVDGDIRPETSIEGAFGHYLWEKAE